MTSPDVVSYKATVFITIFLLKKTSILLDLNTLVTMAVVSDVKIAITCIFTCKFPLLSFNDMEVLAL